MNPALKWGDQYKVMREKLVTSITKLLATEINSFQTYMYFNMYMTRTVFFGCGIIDLSVSQDKEMRWIYKSPISRKLQLGEKFPRAVLYSYRSALGVGFRSAKNICCNGVTEILYR